MLKVSLGELQKEALMDIIRKLNQMPVGEEAEAEAPTEDEGDVIDLGDLLDQSENGPLAKLLAAKGAGGKGVEMKAAHAKVIPDEDELE